MNLKTPFATILIFAGSALPSFGQLASELLNEGREAFLNYDFSKASNLYSQAKKKAQSDDTDFSSKYNTFTHQLSSARNFLGRVEKVVVIDSITVPRHEFFKAYRLPVSAGFLGDATALPYSVDDVDYVFTNEAEDYKLWSQPDSIGRLQLVESSLLTDGKWSEATPLDDELAEDSDAIFPFMMADGVTLYYADNGENSIGGYDIMIAKRDAADGTFLQPSNLGFPYNSPFDDYLLAIDEYNGVGWWATDRNQLEDELTIYVFTVSDIRQNYPSDQENIIGFARIDDYIATQPEDADYDELLAAIREIDPTERTKKHEFDLPASNSRKFYRYDDLPSIEAKAAMKRYLAAKEELDNSENDLRNLRMKYHQSKSDSMIPLLRKQESAIEKQRKEVKKLLSDVYKNM